MENKVALVVPYFGKLPGYYQLFLDSCSYNINFDWLIFSDDTSEYRYPPNVHFIEMTFEQCRELVQACFDFTVTLHTPQKLCDYKCAYGYIFDKYLEGYDWWGHCDLDQIFGNLGAFITDEMMSAYDKIGSIGHLSLYRNTPENNAVFMNTDRYREVFTTTQGCGFDEWLPGNVNEIYLNTDHPVFINNLGADVNSYRTSFQLVDYSAESGVYEKSPVSNSIFLFDKGTLTQIYEENSGLKSKEYPYVHLQKRPMKDCRSEEGREKFFIVPNCFVDANKSRETLLREAKIRGLINTQYVKVKWKSFKYRLHNGDWKFTNVFKK